MLRVCESCAYRLISAVAAHLGDGQTILVDPLPAVMEDCAVITKSNVIIRGVLDRAGKRPAVGNKSCSGKGVLVVSDPDLRNVSVEGLEISGARASDHNGAPIRFQASGLTVRNAFIHDSDKGIMSEGPRTLVDQIARTPEELASTFAYHLRAMLSPKAVLAFDAILVVSTDHSRVFREAGWSKERLRKRLIELTTMPGEDLVRGALGVAEGLPESVRGRMIPKFRDQGIQIVHAGGGAGLFSAIIPGWANGELGSQTLAREIKP